MAIDDPLCHSKPIKEFDRLFHEVIFTCAKSTIQLQEAERMNIWMDTTKLLLDIGFTIDIEFNFASSLMSNRKITKHRPRARRQDDSDNDDEETEISRR